MYTGKHPKNSCDLDLEIQGTRAVVKVHVHAKYHRAECSDSSVIVDTNFLVLSRNDKRSENPIL